MTNYKNNLPQVVEMAVPIGSLEAYRYWVNRLPILSAEEEHSLAVKFQEEGDLNAARQLVLSHLRFVVRIAAGFSGYGLAQADLIQEGTIGLMKAVKRFDPSVGVRLITFAVHWIKSEIHEFIIRNWRIVKIATTKAQRKLFFNLRKMSRRLGWFTESEVDDVAKTLNVSPAEVRQMEARLLHDNEVSFHAQSEDDDNAYLAPENYLADLNSDPIVCLEHDDTHFAMNSKLQAALLSLDARSRGILERRWLNENKATLHDLAAEYNVSAERIRQLEQNALKKVKENF
jgi:RNA polymerase sigma-32 factor